MRAKICISGATSKRCLHVNIALDAFSLFTTISSSLFALHKMTFQIRTRFVPKFFQRFLRINKLSELRNKNKVCTFSGFIRQVTILSRFSFLMYFNPVRNKADV